MRLFLLLGLLLLAAPVTPSASSENSDPYWMNLVRTELSMRSSGVSVYASFTQKNLPKLGDCAGIALVKLVDMSKEIPPTVVAASLSIIQDAFSAPAYIAVKADREPKVTLVFLDYLRGKTSEPRTRQDIDQTIAFVRASASAKEQE